MTPLQLREFDALEADPAAVTFVVAALRKIRKAALQGADLHQVLAEVDQVGGMKPHRVWNAERPGDVWHTMADSPSHAAIKWARAHDRQCGLDLGRRPHTVVVEDDVRTHTFELDVTHVPAYYVELSTIHHDEVEEV